MLHRTALTIPSLFRPVVIVLAVVTLLTSVGRAVAEPSALRRTAIVRAIERARPAVVSIHGRKTLRASRDALGNGEAPRRVNGMGTGVVLDGRGYIVTNDHVVEGVSRIHVTLSDGRTFIARLIERDRRTDLALIKIDVPEQLSVITIGTSADLMVGEPVVAVGNAYGYEETVTRGVISALHRTVQINDSQTYEDLIQTDASINPGNSGGPLLNIEGKMIGMNVAVRSGAQGIGFAIPIDAAIDIATELLSIRRLDNHWHGIVPEKLPLGEPGLVIGQVEKDSPAAQIGLQPGDRITAVGAQKVVRLLDFERALLGRRAGEPIELAVRRSSHPLTLELVLREPPRGGLSLASQVWNAMGMRLTPIAPGDLGPLNSRYHGGLKVTAVRARSPADDQGILPGDILVGMHIWETVSMDNVAYVLRRIDRSDLRPLKFYVLRSEQPYFGYLSITATQRR